MKTNNNTLGLVTKKFNDFFLVDLKNQVNSGNSEKFLCKVKKSINFKNQLIYVGDEVVIENIDLKSKRAVITSLKKRKNLLAELKQKECSIFMGPSGVGKTTLLNMIIPGLQNSTSPVSNKIKRGKNTTRNVELFSISKQSYIVDTPGFNMQPLEVDIKLLPNLYSEIYKQVIEEGIKCKFRNCLHLNDEGCNLNKSFERYSFYREMIDSSKSHYYQNQED